MSKRVLITGGASGLGAALAAEFVGRGDRVLVTDLADSYEAPGADYFIVEPDGAQLAGLPALRPMVDSVFSLDEFEAAFARLDERGKHGKVVLRVRS